MKFKYINSKGVVIDFSDYPYWLQEGDLVDYSWQFDTVEGSRNRIANVRRGIGERQFKLALIPDTSLTYEEKRAKLLEAAETLYNAIEYDVINNVDGRIETDSGYYFPCRIFTSSKSDWLSGTPYMFTTFTATSTENAWIKPVTKSFYKENEIKDNTYLDYEFDYEYDYASARKDTQFWDLKHLEPCDFVLRIYGSAVNPSITINGHKYVVYTSLADSEYLTIDSRDATVIKTTANGSTVSVYDLRGKEESVFELLPVQSLELTWQGTFGFDFTAYVKRSEPKWS